MSDDYDALITAYEDGLRAIDGTIADLQRQRTAIATRLTLLRARADTGLSHDEIPFEQEEQVILTPDIFPNRHVCCFGVRRCYYRDGTRSFAEEASRCPTVEVSLENPGRVSATGA